MRYSLPRSVLAGIAAGAAAGVAASLVQLSQAQRSALVHRTNLTTRRAIEELDVLAESRFIEVNGLRLHAVVAGPVDAPLVVLLHGFPECWYSWRHQIAALARAGYRVVALDQRGYNLSDKPGDVASYQLDQLTGDVLEVIRAMGRERAIVVGHDWGGVVAWRLAMDYPDRVEKLIILNSPHPVAILREFRDNPAQRLKSWYILFFQLPWLPELTLAVPLFAARFFFQRLVVRPHAFSDTDIEVMATALAQPGARSAMIHWYRASLRYRPARRTRAVTQPTLLIWGENDPALEVSLTQGLERWVPNLSRHYVQQCSHWVQNEAPDEVNARLLAFLR